MTPPTNRTTSDVFVSLAYAAVPLALALVIGYSIGSLVAGDLASEEAVVVADRLMSVFFSTFALGTLGAIGALYYRLRDHAAAVDLAAIAEGVATGKLHVVAEQARASHSVTPALEALLIKLEQQRATLQRASQLQRNVLEGMGGSVTTLGENMRQGLEGVDELEQVAGAGVSSHKGISDSVDGLSRSAEETSSSILEMAAINNEVAENIH
ncbi:MAG: hypothetical protein AAB426_06720, partial [Myxococcota bacterium]